MPKRFTIILAIIAIAAAIALLRFTETGPSAQSPITPVAIADPPTADAETFNNALYLYVAFFAIQHDHYLASEATSVETRVELTNLPADLDADGQLARFPSMARRIGAEVDDIARLDSPTVDFMQAGVFCEPAQRRVLLLHGKQLVQDGYGDLFRDLADAQDCDYSVEMRFYPGDYGDAGDLGDYAVRFAGRVKNATFSVDTVGGRIATAESLIALLKAAVAFDEIQTQCARKGEFVFDAADEAAAVRRLAVRVYHEPMTWKEADGKSVVVTQEPDLAILVAYERFGETVLARK